MPLLPSILSTWPPPPPLPPPPPPPSAQTGVVAVSLPPAMAHYRRRCAARFRERCYFERRPHSNTCERSCALVAIAALAAAATAACTTRAVIYHQTLPEPSAPSPPSLAATHRPPFSRRVACGGAALPVPTNRLVSPPCRLAVAWVLVMVRSTIHMVGREAHVLLWCA